MRILVFSLLLSITVLTDWTFALTQFPKGRCEIEGKILRKNNVPYLSVNYGTEAESVIMLVGVKNLTEDFEKHYTQNAVFEFKFDRVQLSHKIDASEIKFIRYVGDALRPRIYNTPLEFKCSEVSYK